MTRNIALLLLGLAVVTTMMVAGENGPLTQMAASKPEKPALASKDKAADIEASKESEAELAEAFNEAANEDFAAEQSQKKAPVFAEFKMEESEPPAAEAPVAPQLAKAPAKPGGARSSSYENSLMAAGHVDYSFDPVLKQKERPETAPTIR